MKLHNQISFLRRKVENLMIVTKNKEEVYQGVELSTGDNVLIREHGSKDDKRVQTKWLKATVLKRYPTFVLFGTEPGYCTCLMNTDINERRVRLGGKSLRVLEK